MRFYSFPLLMPVMLMCSQPAAAHITAESERTGAIGLIGLLTLLFIVCAAGTYGKGLRRMWRRAGLGRGIRQWQAACFYLGIVALCATLVWPLHGMSPSSLSLHMVQHMVLIAVAAPLLALGKPWAPILLSFPEVSRARLLGWWRSIKLLRLQVLIQPPLATALHGTVVWLWHAPFFYNLALTNEIVHVIEHISFLGSALLFWWALLRSGSRADGFGPGVLAALLTLMHTGVLGALLTFAPAPLYERYDMFSRSGLSPLEDQQLAGLIMWIPPSAVYLTAGLALISIGLESARRQSLAMHR